MKDLTGTLTAIRAKILLVHQNQESRLLRRHRPIESQNPTTFESWRSLLYA